MPQATATCVQCAKPLTAGAKFCPFCATEQREIKPSGRAQPSDQDPSVRPPADPFSGSYVYSRGSDSAGTTGAVLLRATEQIWHADDPEGRVEYGQSRPLIVADEQVTHLAHTDHVLRPKTLLTRAQDILSAQQVPVDVEVREVAWISDPASPRERLVASLKNHNFSDLKLLFGVDYLGKWASIQLHVAFEPDPVRASNADIFRLLAILCLVFMFIAPAVAYSAFERGYYGTNLEALGSAALVGIALFVGTICLFRHAGRVEARERAERRARQAARMARTFAVDDMRLFCSAMQEVYQQIVDDIVQKGGEVVRITGGQGGFFDAAGLTQASAPARRSDAAQIGV